MSNATTASPDLVTRIISPDPRLRTITKAIVLKPGAHRLVVEVYRDSRTAPGWWSCDVYPVVDGKPYTLHDITDAEAQGLRRLVASLTG